MKLLSFPYLVQKEILEHLPMNQIFFLSLCSQNTKNVIKRIQKYQLEKISHLHYVILGAFMVLKSPWADCLVFMSLFRTEFDFRKKLSWCKEGDAVEEVQVNELGTSINFFRSPMNKTGLHAKFTFDDSESIIESIYNHLCDLMGHHLKVHLLADFREDQFSPILQNIRTLEIREFHDFSSTRIEKYLSRCTGVEVLWWHEESPNNIRLEKNSKVFEMDTLDVWRTRFLARDVLQYFKGRHAFLRCHSITTGDVIRFLNEWRSGEKFQNLEVISMKSPQQIREIRRSVEFKELNASIEYSFISKSPFEVSKFESRFYIVRESDGRVASVLLKPEKVVMGVWNMTEIEFLEKFQRSIP